MESKYKHISQIFDGEFEVEMANQNEVTNFRENEIARVAWVVWAMGYTQRVRCSIQCFSLFVLCKFYTN